MARCTSLGQRNEKPVGASRLSRKKTYEGNGKGSESAWICTKDVVVREVGCVFIDASGLG